MSTGDAQYIKNLNRRILIEHVIKEQTLSRSDLARVTGLNKATVSAQISKLIDDGIIRETKVGHIDSPGRKPILIEMNGQAGYSIGIDIDANEFRFVFIDLKGKPIERKVVPIDQGDVDEIISIIQYHLKPLIETYNESHKPIGLTGIAVGIHGIINSYDQIVFTPNQKWQYSNFKSKFEEVFNVPVVIDNNANLSAYGEQVYYENIQDLFCITLYSGIGLGIINNSKIYRGYDGFAGEIGHMVVNPDGELCSCGNKGCWELYASERALRNRFNAKFGSMPQNPAEIFEKPKYESELDSYIQYLAIGLNNIINIFNPQRIVLNGAMINQNPEVIQSIERHLKSKINSYETIHLSHLGEFACALGGAALVLKNYLNINTLDFVEYEYFNSHEKSAWT
ncbi:ROK family transcriptional regulator [Piscibacillus salipiscarius]|uniref:ROK family protein n=1 Tax=Piscibacillus salipiscarius TaxID=299480 RepID=A0ABW5QAY9_9BACI|nr:ROK family transcriptional regulator [Piscibacillus salipiscarius]